MSTPTGHPEPARLSSSQTRDRTVSRPPAPGQGAPGSELQGPDGLAFYAPPAPLPPTAAGQVVWARPLTGAAALAGAAENLLILYHSRTLAGQDTAVSGTISLPRGKPPDGGGPVLSWAHGTTGVADICAPSRDAPGHPSHIYNQLADAMLNQWVNRGWAVVQTDYEGLGTPGRHPYLVGASEARGTVDIAVGRILARRHDPRIPGLLGEVNRSLQQGIKSGAFEPDAVAHTRSGQPGTISSIGTDPSRLPVRTASCTACSAESRARGS